MNGLPVGLNPLAVVFLALIVLALVRLGAVIRD